MHKTIKWLMPVAACLAIAVVAAISIAQVNPPVAIGSAKTGEGDTLTISFAKGNLPAKDSEIANGAAMESRDLTADENKTLFGSLADTHTITAYGHFYHYNSALAFVEGRATNDDGLQTRIILYANDLNVLDTVVEGNKTSNDIFGTAVHAGYFVTDKNSKGIRNIIYYATFHLGEAACYLELGGEKSQSDALKTEITAVIGKLIQSGAGDLAQISK
ncbi:MAG: hypothetical protein LBS96_05060 [Oscillospiraceae bacterium]|nr:hypothetical protein [Oscillospiraceae bacterium]